MGLPDLRFGQQPSADASAGSAAGVVAGFDPATDGAAAAAVAGFAVIAGVVLAAMCME